MSRGRPVRPVRPMRRVPEPEVMDEGLEVEAYEAADFRAVNRLVAGRALRAAGRRRGRAIDLGTGPAEIPIAFCELGPRWSVVAVDASPAMLRVARRKVAAAGLATRVELVRADAKALRRWHGRFDLAFSNSLLHHLPDPAPFWRELKRLLRPGGAVMVQDLFRPPSRAAARAIVARHAGGESRLLRQLFYQSLLAAFTPQEVRAQLAAAGLEGLRVRKVSDRHLVVSGRP